MLLRALSLGVAIAAAFSSVFTVTLNDNTVIAPDEYDAKAAAQILKAGDNAVDAAMVTAFTLAVIYPEIDSISSDSFMTLYMDDKLYFLDYREVTPKAASKVTCLDDKGGVIENLSLVDAKAAGMSGTMMDLWEVHKYLGKLPWSELLTSTIGYAQKGFKVTGKQFQYYQDAVALFNGKTNSGDYFGHVKADEAFPQPDLAKTPECIVDKGPDEFYRGHTADLLVIQMRQDKGLITYQDLANYKVRWRKPVCVDWQGSMPYTVPLPSSGGIILAQLLGIKKSCAVDFKGVELDSACYIHPLAEIKRCVLADYTDYLGDLDLLRAPMAHLADPIYLKQRTAGVSPTTISPTERVRPGLESHQTTHSSIADADGNAVNSTYTLSWDLGSGVMVKGVGSLLNDEMGDFSVKPGMASVSGAVGSDANAIEPGRRTLSSMDLSVATRDSKVSLVVDTLGDSWVLILIFQVLNSTYGFHLPLRKTVATQRVHHQLLLKDMVYYNAYMLFAGKITGELKVMGYTLEDQGWNTGSIQAIHVDDKALETASDSCGRSVGLVMKP